ncbi:purine-cytosine permease family protein [Oceanimonas baumannii]|uniref:Allantoin permease n=1 Tax=Oceanimonas baumannii TaxID=129578 RepID=A0A235CL68_9GAMM|nr:allantoin permease [Oceanimonas baumannii]OYD25313.1 allantoin permease [Oceanimonas baumannii]TDW62389.1 purine-cytosine permease-like protein [Oceanimonas baumannii]
MANLSSPDPDFTRSPVPSSARMPRFGLTMAWWSVCSAMFWLVVAATLAINYGTLNTLAGLALSAFCYALINGVLVRHAISTGLSVGLFSQTLLGRSGAALATLIFFATALYYGVFEGSVIAVAIQGYFPSLSLNQAYLLVVLYSVPLVLGSVQRWLDKLNGLLLPFYLIGLAAAVLMALNEYGYSHAWLELGPEGGAPADGWWRCFTTFMGVWILMMYTYDYARLGRKEDSGYHATINFGLPFYLFTFVLNGMAGIFLAASIPTDGPVTEVSVVLALLKLMGFWGLAFVWVSQTRINTANFYLATVNLQSFVEKASGLRLPKLACGVLVGAIVYLLMLTDVFSFILQALAYQGILVVAWVGLALSHIRFEPHPLCHEESAPRLHKAGISAWLVAAGLGVACMEAGEPFAAWSAPVTFLGAFVCYRLFTRYQPAPVLTGD